MNKYLFSTFGRNIYGKVFQLHAVDKDAQRREFILIVLLAGLFCIGSLALLVTIVTFIFDQNTIGIQTIFITAAFLMLVVGCLRAVRAGYIRIISYLLLLVLMASTTQLMLHWGFDLPQVLLEYVMTIVIAGILLGSRVGLQFTLLSILLVLAGGWLQTHNYWHADLTWRRQVPLFVDGIGYVLVFGIIGLVSWLSNREMDHSLRRAQRSEAALLKERDSLEVKVTDRTKELERIQLIRVMELERFAVFGRMNASLVHDMSSPLMAARLNLQQVDAEGDSRLKQVNKNLAQIQRQLQAARLQLRGDSALEHFVVADEVRQIVDIIQPVARKRRVRLKLHIAPDIRLFGDSLRFSQIVSNLLINAVESYPVDGPVAKREVSLSVEKQADALKLVVHDRGSGIAPPDLDRIFEPFYTKKPVPEQHTGMGIGLSIVKQFVEQDFRGTLTVRSSRQAGTDFIALLKPASAAESKDGQA